MFLPQQIIKKKRDNKSLTKEEIDWFIKNIANYNVADAHISALAMAIIFNKLSKEELVYLTLAMRDSGEVVQWGFLNGPVVDKHSTGGVGDLTSLMLAPMLAACGAYVPMIAGRGLGHTGGTLDKLDSIPGYNTTPDINVFKNIVSKVGCAIIGQTSNLAPADKRMYAVRDTTATTESLELITSSILSKKLAAGLTSLVMDIKTGNGAFLTQLEESKALAKSIVSIANSANCKTTALITDMNQPLANCAGNALEIVEVIKYLKGECTNKRLEVVTSRLAIEMLCIIGIANSKEDAKTKLNSAINSGKALEIFAKMVHSLGGPTDFIEKYLTYLPKASIVKPVYSSIKGKVKYINTNRLGLIVVTLGGGRTKVEDKIDYSVGLSNIISLGEEANSDTPLAIVYAKDQTTFNIAEKLIKEAIVIDQEYKNIDLPPLVYEYIS